MLGQWQAGISAFGTGTTVRKNQVSVSVAAGTYGGGNAVVTGNIVTATGTGIFVENDASAIGDSTYGGWSGITVLGVESEVESAPFSGIVTRNDIAGNTSCGLVNDGGGSVVNATSNYWGSASGPGPDPADDVCNEDGGSTPVVPFATKPFIVKAPIKP